MKFEDVSSLFRKHKCGVIMISQKKHIYDIPSGEFLFWHPDKNLLELKGVVGKNKNNMPIVTSQNITSWYVDSLDELDKALNSVKKLINN